MCDKNLRPFSPQGEIMLSEDKNKQSAGSPGYHNITHGEPRNYGII